MLVLAGLLLGFAHAADVDIKGSIGWTGFLDEGPENHLLLGGSGRFYVWRRLSIEPEFQYLRQGSRHYDLVFLPSVNWDFRRGRIVPYVTAGLGALRFAQRSPVNFSHVDAFASAGAGAKFYLNQNWFVSPEFRIGWEPHARFSVGIGYTFRD